MYDGAELFFRTLVFFDGVNNITEPVIIFSGIDVHKFFPVTEVTVKNRGFNFGKVHNAHK